MTFRLREIQDLREKGSYREVIDAVKLVIVDEDVTILKEQGPFLLERAWAHYQLGEMGEAKKWSLAIVSFFSETTDTGESARRLLAHCAEREGYLDEADSLLLEIPRNPARDNLALTIFIKRQRKGEVVQASNVMELVTAALERAPYEPVDAHIMSNAAWLFFEAREQKDVERFLPILVGLIEIAIGIYETTKAAQNHLATALFRASKIFLEVADWPKGALLVIEESIAIWEQLVSSEGGERYQQNLEGARNQREKILVRDFNS